MTNADRFRVLPGGRSTEAVIGGVVLDTSDAKLPPDVLILEEDSYLVLSAETKIAETSEHPIRTFTAVWDQKPEPIGSVVRMPGRPPRLLAVVLDLSVEPSTNEGAVAQALKSALSAAEELGAHTVRLDLLGAMHGYLPVEVALNLLRRALLATKLHAVARIQLVAPKAAAIRVEQILAEWSEAAQSRSSDSDEA